MFKGVSQYIPAVSTLYFAKSQILRGSQMKALDLSWQEITPNIYFSDQSIWSGQAWGFMPIIPITWKAEIGGL
jgi:hypothetical protein